jgi:hypothetical protein
VRTASYLHGTYLDRQVGQRSRLLV